MIALLAGLALAAKPLPAPTEPLPEPVDPLAWRATPPSPGAEIQWSPPVAVEFKLSNGILVTLIERDELPLVSVTLQVLAGRDSVPAAKAGLPSFTADLMDEATTQHDAVGLTDAADALGASIGTGSDGESSFASAAGLAETLPQWLDLLREVVRGPLFGNKDFKRQKAETLLAAESTSDDPGQMARTVWRSEFFGAGSPLGALDGGTPASVAHFTRKDVEAYWSTWWVPGAAHLYVTGAIDPAKAKELLEARFGDWSGAPPPATPTATPANPDATRIVFVEKVGAVQSVLRVGQLGPLRKDADWWSAQTMNSLLGGMFSSRINLELREAHGWSYGAFSSYWSDQRFGTFVAGSSVQADATAPAVAAIVKEIRGMAEAPPSEAELATGKDALRLSQAGSFETNGQINDSLAALATGGLPADWLAQMPAAVAKVTAADVQASAKTHLDAGRLLIVVVGPKVAQGDDGVSHDTVAELQALGLGPVTVRELWTKP